LESTFSVFGERKNNMSSNRKVTTLLFYDEKGNKIYEESAFNSLSEDDLNLFAAFLSNDEESNKLFFQFYLSPNTLIQAYDSYDTGKIVQITYGDRIVNDDNEETYPTYRKNISV